jgi:SAM-dependent methyltransferase
MAATLRNPYRSVGAPVAFRAWEHYSPNEIQNLGCQAAEELQSTRAEGEPIAILDIGAGDGQFTHHFTRGVLAALRGATASVLAVDDAPRMVECCRKEFENVGSDVQFKAELYDANEDLLAFVGAQQSGGPPARFDIVIITYVLHYLTSKRWTSLLRQVARVLKPGGLLVQGQISGMISELDGYVCEQPTTPYSRFWKQYFDERNRFANWNYIYDQPDFETSGRSNLRVSRMDPVWQFLTEQRAELQVEFARRETKNWLSQYDLTQFPALIGKGAVSSLANDLTEGQIADLGQKMASWLDQHVPAAERPVDIRWVMEFIFHRKLGNANATPRVDGLASQLSQRYLQFSAERRMLTPEDIPEVLRVNELVDHRDSPSSLRHRFNSLLDFCITPSIAGSKFVGLVLWDILSKKFAFVGRTDADYQSNIDNYLKAIKNRDDLVYFRNLYLPKDRVCAHVIEVCASRRHATLKRALDLQGGEGLASEYLAPHLLLGVDGQTTFVHYLAGVFKPGQPELGAGGLVIITTGQPLDLHLQRLLELVAQTELNGLGSAVLYRGQIESARLAAAAAVMSRNLSHNVGSHVLANPKLEKAIGLDKYNSPASARAHLSVFHQTAQNRLDFIARAITRNEERAEPMFFLRGVMDGLLRQSVLLDVLLEDQGFGIDARRVYFDIKTPAEGSSFIEYSLQVTADGIKRFQPTRESIEPTDVLVGVGGGMIGCQALYSIVENVMRNAAKYGSERDSAHTLHLYLELRPALAEEVANHWRYFVVELWENLSTRSNGADVQIRDHLRDTLIDEFGQTRRIGQGIEEMRIAAALLSSGQTFYGDAQCKRVASKSAPSSYARYLAEDGVGELSAQPLRCYAADRSVATGAEKDGLRRQQSIVYQVLMQRPPLVGVVGRGAPVVQDAESSGIFQCAGVPELAQLGAAFGVLLDTGDLPIDLSITALCVHHWTLPLRLLIVTADEENHGRWTQALATVVLKPGQVPTDKPWLPDRRVRVLHSPVLHRALGETGPPDTSFLGVHGWQALLLQLYHAWLVAFKGVPEQGAWRLVIGFERSPDQLRRAWQTQLGRFSRNEQAQSSAVPGCSMAVEVHIGGKLGNDREIISSAVPAIDPGILIDPPQAWSNLLIFDNHGKAITMAKKVTLDCGVRMVHEFSGTKSISLFQSLETPPREPFAFAWLIYSLVESSLLTVGVIDERVSGAAAASDATLREFTRAGIFPVFSLRSQGCAPHWLDPKTLDKLKANFGQDVHDCIKAAEGLHVDGPKAALAFNNALGQVSVDAPGGDDSLIPELDVIIVHEGVVDTVHGGPFWRVGQEDQLFLLSPRVVRTSGRGSVPRNLSEHLPFLEFSRLSETTYDGLNKYALGRALLGAMARKAQE